MKKTALPSLALALLLLWAAVPRAYAAGSGTPPAVGNNEISAVWIESGAVYAQVSASTPGATPYFAAYGENGQFLGLWRLSETDDGTYSATLPALPISGKALLLDSALTPLAAAKEPGEKPEPAQPSIPESGPQVLTVGGKAYALGMREADLLSIAGDPAETLPTTATYRWYVYGTETYADFFMAGALDGKVIALCSGGPAFSWEGYQAGAKGAKDTSGYASLFTDKNDGSILHAVLLTDSASLPRCYDTSAEALAGESRANFHMTNAFRLYHGLSLLTWSEAAAKAARMHSQDMADQNYFNHSSQDGRTPWARMEAQGIRYMSAAENISAGRSSGVQAYNGWVNSSGHRDNMLSGQTWLGVGFGYNENSSYGFYATQDYYS